MCAIFTNSCPKNNPNVGKYTLHGAYGIEPTQTTQDLAIPNAIYSIMLEYIVYGDFGNGLPLG